MQSTGIINTREEKSHDNIAHLSYCTVEHDFPGGTTLDLPSFYM